MFKLKSLFSIAVLMLLVAACQPVSVEDAQAQLCANLVAFETALGGVEALTPESTVEEAQAAFDAADEAWEAVLNSAYTLREAEYDNLDQAYEDLDDSIRQISEQETIAEAAESVQTQLANVRTAYDEFYTLADCAP